MTIVKPASRRIVDAAGLLDNEWWQKFASLFDAANNSTATLAAITAAGTAMITAANAAAQEALLASYLPAFPPQGRLTLTSGTPVLTSTVSGATTVYYTPYVGQTCPLWSGTQFYPANIGGELSQATSDTTKSPAAVAASKLYDMFVWSDGGTYRCTRGPAWSSDTARGTGAGTTELNRVNGIWVNKNAITNGPAAGYGTYVGTIASNGSSTIDFILGGTSAGGTAAVLNIWNAYNRRVASPVVSDSTASYSYTTASWRSADNSNTMRISFVVGLQEDAIEATHQNFESGTSAFVQMGIALDATNTSSGVNGDIGASTSAMAVATWSGYALGSHFLQATEYGGASATFYSAGNSGLRARILC